MMAFQSSIKTYLFTYQHEGASWVLELKADSAEDARRRLSRLQYASYTGELMAKVPVSRNFSGVLSPVITFFLWLLGAKQKKLVSEALTTVSADDET